MFSSSDRWVQRQQRTTHAVVAELAEGFVTSDLEVFRHGARPMSVPASRVDPDQVLVDALRRGDPVGHELLVDSYGSRVYRLALRITSSPEDAEEAAQDALWTAARKIDSFKGDAAFGSWLYRIAANAAYQKLRRRRNKEHEIALEDVLPAIERDGLHFEPMDDWSRRVDDQALQRELRHVLEDAIESLPPDYRTTLVLHDVEGMSNPEIAEALGISLPAVKSRVHRSRLYLRQRLSAYVESGRRP